MTTMTYRKGRWTPLGIAAMVFGFVIWWPLGLAVLAYIMWGGSVDNLAKQGIDELKKLYKANFPTEKTTGNAAFDAYREETLSRLEEEQAEFNEFMSKLREARDRDEFERFMADRKDMLSKADKS